MILNIGNIIRVEGFVMLRNMDDGCYYKLINIREYDNNLVYDFAKGKRGRKRYVSHYVYDIDFWLKNNSENNFIEVIK